MKLHEAIQQVLLEENRELNASQIAKIVNERKLYKRGDEKPVPSSQISARVNNYPLLFYKDKNRIGLNTWKLKLAKKESLLFKEILFILEQNDDPMDPKVIADTINEREIYYKDDKTPVNADEVLDEVKKNENVFQIVENKVELAEWHSYEDSFKEYAINFIANDESKNVEQQVFNNSLIGLSVSNFKPYNGSQRLNLKPITLLFGPNSSGKSSFIHSMLYLQNAFDQKDLDPHYMKISGDSVDLGGFRQLIHRNDIQRRVEYLIELDKLTLSKELQTTLLADINSIKLKIEIGQPLKEKFKKQIIKSEDGTSFYEESPTGEFESIGRPRVEKYEILLDDETMLSFGFRGSDLFKIDQFNYSNRVISNIIEALLLSNTTASEITDDDYGKLEDVMDDILGEFYSSASDIIPRRIKTISKSSLNKIKAISKENRNSEFEETIRIFLPSALNDILEGFYESASSSLSTLIYLGPIRSYPPRHLSFEAVNNSNYQSGGALAWDRLRDNEDVRNKINKWLSETNKLKSNYRVEVRKHVDPKSNEFNSILEDIEEEQNFKLDVQSSWEGLPINKIIEDMNSDAIEGIKELVLVDNEGTVVSHRDVGFGISQVIPVLVYTLANKNKIVMIEQPEIHLHPALQAELGDVMIESALGENKNTLILENHSEHMILRILRRIRETSSGELPDGKIPIKPEDVSVIYVQNTRAGVVLHNIPITEDGDFEKNWPEGFFEERDEELFGDSF
jgi:AAA15 family ATPase/GTPase